jgi:uncharacterized phage protein (TIGR02218 family)
VAVNGTELAPGAFSVDATTGLVTLGVAPAAGVTVTAGFVFDVPVRFDTDRIEVNLAAFEAGAIPSIPNRRSAGLMRALQAELQARLESGAATLCTCWRLLRRDGAVLGFTDHDMNVPLDDLVCLAQSALDTAAQENGLGLAIDTTEVAGALSATAISEADVAAGLYDGAAVERWLVDWTAPHLRECLFAGTLGEIRREGAAFRAEVLGLSAALNAPLGRVCQRLCDARLGDSRCGVDLARPDRLALVRVLAIEPRGLAVAGLGEFVPGWFAHGTARWNDGAEAVILAHWVEDGVHRLALDGGRAVAGTQLTVTAGCDREAGTCRDKFDNLLNFQGFPHMPGEDWAMTAAPASGGLHDGGVRR